MRNSQERKIQITTKTNNTNISQMLQITMNFPTPDTGISKYFSCLLSLSYTITLPSMGLLIFVLHNIYLNIFEGQHSFSPIFTEKYLFSKNDVSFFLCCWIVFDLCEFYSFYTLNFGKYVSHFFILSVLLRSGWNNMIKLTKKRLNCKFLSHIFLEMLKSRFLESPPIKYITLFRGCL